jgi:hypothetical protein
VFETFEDPLTTPTPTPGPNPNPNPNPNQVFETFEDPVNRELHIIMEMCTGGALVSRMK